METVSNCGVLTYHCQIVELEDCESDIAQTGNGCWTESSWHPRHWQERCSFPFNGGSPNVWESLKLGESLRLSPNIENNLKLSSKLGESFRGEFI